MSGNILRQIREAADGLSRAERRVADWLLRHPRDAQAMALGELAAVVGVSEPTVIRFCRSFGLSGYRDLRTRLLLACQQPESYAHSDVTSEDDQAVAIGKVFDNAIRALMVLRGALAEVPFPVAVEALLGARQIIFVGLGASGMVAQDACHKFFRLGIPCSTALDAQTIAQRCAIVTATDVIVACSHTGRWPALINALRLARSRGATVIAVTDPASALVEVADLVLPCAAPEDTSVYTPMTSRLAHLAILDALQVALALALGEAARVLLRESKAALRVPAEAAVEGGAVFGLVSTMKAAR